jgi:predicted  nucleic acid-binding Zn ribbon protein
MDIYALKLMFRNETNIMIDKQKKKTRDVMPRALYNTTEEIIRKELPFLLYESYRNTAYRRICPR